MRVQAFWVAAPTTPVTRDIFLMSPKDEPEWELTGVQGGRRSFGTDIVEYRDQQD